MIYICSLAEMPQWVARFRPSHLISLLSPDELPPTPPGVAPENHLKVGVNDIWEPVPGQILPGNEHIDSLIAFGTAWGQASSLLVHCYAGVSRSTAAALILLALDADGREHEAAQLLRRKAPHAIPNRRMIEVADERLGRAGRLVDAVERIGVADFIGVAPLTRLPRQLPQTEPGAGPKA